MNDVERMNIDVSQRRAVTFGGMEQFSGTIGKLVILSGQERIQFETYFEDGELPTIIMPNWVLDKIVPKLAERAIGFSEVPVPVGGDRMVFDGVKTGGIENK